jgi:hypothetical protein
MVVAHCTAAGSNRPPGKDLNDARNHRLDETAVTARHRPAVAVSWPCTRGGAGERENLTERLESGFPEARKGYGGSA